LHHFECWNFWCGLFGDRFFLEFGIYIFMKEWVLGRNCDNPEYPWRFFKGDGSLKIKKTKIFHHQIPPQTKCSKN
jgi:hypothetical protein